MFFGKIWSSYPGKATATVRAALPIPKSACNILCVPKQWFGCQCLGFLMCAQMFIHAIAHWGCTNTVKESALKVDSWRKMSCCAGELNPRQQRADPMLY